MSIPVLPRRILTQREKTGNVDMFMNIGSRKSGILAPKVRF